MKYTVDLRYVVNGLLSRVLATYDSIDDANEHATMACYDYGPDYYVEVGIAR